MRYEPKNEDWVKRLNDFMDFTGKEPEHTETSEDGSYLLVPIAYLEADLRFVYGGLINIRIKEQKEMFGHITMFIDLEVFHPVYEIFQTFSGTAAIAIESEKPGDFKGTSKVMIVEPLKTAIALCYSECVKNAAKKIDMRFGKDLNRKSKPTNMTKTKKTKTEIEHERMEILINDCDTIKELMSLKRNVPEALNEKFNQRFIDLGDTKNG